MSAITGPCSDVLVCLPAASCQPKSECASAVGMQDSDDDGESAAGGRLLHMLQIAGAENVVVIVSRW